MKTNLILGFLVIASLATVTVGLVWSSKLNHEKDVAHYFSADFDTYIFYRPNECMVDDLNWELDGISLSQFFTRQLASGKWKSIVAQKVEKNQYTFVFEQNSGYRDQDLDSLCKQLNITIRREFLSVRDLSNQWIIREIKNAFVLSNAALPNDSKHLLPEVFSRKDENASFACIVNGALQEYYCFPKATKSFVQLKMPDLQVNSIGSMDLDLYNVVPKSVSFFEYLDKDLLTEFYPEWKKSPLLEYVESGVIFSALNNVNFYVLPIADLFSAKDILESTASPTDSSTTQIKALKQVVPGQRFTYALVIENNLVLSNSQSILESISLSYQMQAGFNTTQLFEQIQRNTSSKVHYRWFNRQQLLKSNVLMRMSIPSSYGYSYFRNRDKTMRFVSVSGKNQTKEIPVASNETKVLWNFSLKNIESSFHLNANQVIGIFNPSDRAFSIVDGNGKILTSKALTENLKSIHPLDQGYFLETFEKLYWIPERSVEGQREYNFKGQIQSSIASYTWNGEGFVTFISEQQLHKLSLKTGKIEKLKIPVSLSEALPQLHAFNHKGKLHIGYFSDQFFHAVNVSNNRWTKEPIPQAVLYSEKIDGRIHYIEKGKGIGSHKVLFGGELQIFNDIQPNFSGMVKHNMESIWLLRDKNDFFVYRPTTIKGTSVSVSGVEISAFEPVFSGDRLEGLLILDDVKSEVHYFKRKGEDSELILAQKFRGSKFIKNMNNRQFVTFVDGQLVCYGY